jgi:regulator of sigma E protease
VNPSSFSILQIVLFLVLLSALVVAHEWGHFIIARLFKIRVDDFSIGFGKRILRIGKRGDTEYNIRILPLGGFVKIAGMEPDEEPITRVKDAIVDRSKKADPDSNQIPLIAENTGEGVPYDGPDGFNSKPLWQRSLVILAGPVMSFVAGVLVLCLIGCTVGVPIGKPLNRVVVVSPDGEGHRIGLRAGDRIVAIDGVPIKTGVAMIEKIHNSPGVMLTLEIERNGKTFIRTATPRPAINDATGKPDQVFEVNRPGQLGSVGVLPGDRLVAIDDADITDANELNRVLTKDAGRKTTIDLTRNGEGKPLKVVIPAGIANGGFPDVTPRQIGILYFQPYNQIKRLGLAASFRYGWATVETLFLSLADLIKTHKIQKGAGGIIRMYDYTGIAMTSGVSYVLSLAGQISISLAIFNLFPIPILDGGHLLTFFIEWVRRGKRLSPRMHQAFMLAGLTIIFVLVLLVNGHDLIDKITHRVEQ